MSDDALVARLVARDPEAWEAFLAQYGSLIETTARQVLARTGLQAEVADAAAEVARSLLEDDLKLLRAYRPGTPLGAYLRVIARSRVTDWVRRRAPATLPLTEAGGTEDAPEAAARLAERAARLSQALAILPPREAELLRLFHMEGLGHAALGERLGIPTAQVGIVLKRAREKLREALGEDFLESV